MLNPKQFVKVFRGFGGKDHPDAIDYDNIGGDFSTHIGDAKFYAHDDSTEGGGTGLILEGYLPRHIVEANRDGRDKDHFTLPKGPEVKFVSWRTTTNPDPNSGEGFIGEVDSVSKRQFFPKPRSGRNSR